MEVLDGLPVHVAVLNPKGVVEEANAAWRGFEEPGWNGVPTRPRVGEPFRGVGVRDASGEFWLGEAETGEVLSGGRDCFQAEYCLHLPGGRRWFTMRVERLPEGGAVVCHQEVSRTKELEEQINHNALHDRLTGLPNRALLLDHLSMALKRAKRNPGYSFALIYIDIDRFNMFNESLGHVAGDHLLMAIANRLYGQVRDVDTLSRFGGDEFVLLLDDCCGEEEAIRVAERITEEMARAFRIRRREVYLNLSLGIVVGSGDYNNAGEVLRDADTVLHRAKTRGGNSYELFSAAMRALARKRLRLEMDLRKAVAENSLELHYQPIVSLASGEIKGFEALARWRHEELGMVSPMEFIPVAEETGLIIPLGSWVLRKAAEKLAAMQRNHPGFEGATMSVNISGAQFMRPGFVDEVDHLLRSTGAEPGRLTLELTESVIMSDAERAVEVISQLRDRGLRVVIDDFGTGYSSLSYLQRFPVHSLKVDRSFVLNMDGAFENKEIVKTIIKMAHSLGLEVVAEGVEQHSHMTALANLRCESGQGFLFSKPLAESELDRLVADSATGYTVSPAC